MQKKEQAEEKNILIAKGVSFSMDSDTKGFNNNVLVVGASGCGKTSTIIEPNIKQAVGSYVIVDAKGMLYQKYCRYLRKKGYKVRKLDFVHPGKWDDAHYNYFKYIESDMDILKISHMMISLASDNGLFFQDPFWNQASELLLIAINAYLFHHCLPSERNLKSVLNVVRNCNIDESDANSKSALDYLFEAIEQDNPEDFAVRMYESFRQGAGRTLRSVLISLNAMLARFDTPELQTMLSHDTVALDLIGDSKTALFIVVSDTDRSMDYLANLAISQCIHELTLKAETYPDGRLPLPVRFLLDDFATNVRIAEWPRMISSIRSRGMSAMMMLQSESQLKSGYGNDASTIIANCDTYVYMGDNDLNTAEQIARRTGSALADVLYMPPHHCWVFRRGEKPSFVETLEPVVDIPTAAFNGGVS